MPIHVNRAVEGDYEIKMDNALPFYQSKVIVCPVASYVLSVKLQVKSVVNETFH